MAALLSFFEVPSYSRYLTCTVPSIYRGISRPVTALSTVCQFDFSVIKLGTSLFPSYFIHRRTCVENVMSDVSGKTVELSNLKEYENNLCWLCNSAILLC